MSRDGDGREELRALEAAAPGGLSGEDARRAFAALRRGGLRLISLWSDAGAPDRVDLGTLIGPAIADGELARLYRAWDATRGPVVDEACRLRSSAENLARRVPTSEMREAALRLCETPIKALWVEHAREHGRDFAEHLERFHGFFRVALDAHVELPWLP